MNPGDGGLRRIFPPPRRRPGIIAVLVRWRVELVLAAGLAVFVLAAGWKIAGFLGFAIVLVGVTVRPARRAMINMYQTVVVPHRVRSALRQAGVTDLDGRLPWLVVAYPVGPDDVLVSVVLRAGTTPGDVHEARALIRSACGASEADVVPVGRRDDRVHVVVRRPRWGLLGR